MDQQLLQKPVWNNEDIMKFFNCKVNKAINIKKVAIQKYNGYVPMFPFAVYRDAILKVIGVNLDQELKLQETLKKITQE